MKDLLQFGGPSIRCFPQCREFSSRGWPCRASLNPQQPAQHICSTEQVAEVGIAACEPGACGGKPALSSSMWCCRWCTRLPACPATRHDAAPLPPMSPSASGGPEVFSWQQQGDSIPAKLMFGRGYYCNQLRQYNKMDLKRPGRCFCLTSAQFFLTGNQAFVSHGRIMLNG